MEDGDINCDTLGLVNEYMELFDGDTSNPDCTRDGKTPIPDNEIPPMRYGAINPESNVS